MNHASIDDYRRFGSELKRIRHSRETHTPAMVISSIESVTRRPKRSPCGKTKIDIVIAGETITMFVEWLMKSPRPFVWRYFAVFGKVLIFEGDEWTELQQAILLWRD